MYAKLFTSALALALVIPAKAATTNSDPALASVRAATERFIDVKQALAEGYMRDPSNMCVTSTMMGSHHRGAMGIHYFRPDLLKITQPPHPRVDGGGTHTDFRKPAILIYEPEADGSLQLIGVENLVFEKAWKSAGHSRPPSFEGTSYEHMADDPATPVDEAHGFEPHFDLHVWLYRDNPNGIFAPFNPNVTCAHHRANAAAQPAKGDMPGMSHGAGR
jgi:hypothetical protein